MNNLTNISSLQDLFYKIKEGVSTKLSWQLPRNMSKGELKNLVEEAGFTPINFYIGRTQRSVIVGRKSGDNWVKITPEDFHTLEAKVKAVSPNATFKMFTDFFNPEGIPKNAIQIYVPITREKYDNPLPWREIRREIKETYGEDITLRSSANAIKIFVGWYPNTTGETIEQTRMKRDGILGILQRYDPEIKVFHSDLPEADFVFIREYKRLQ